jgi:hypothetical protein
MFETLAMMVAAVMPGRHPLPLRAPLLRRFEPVQELEPVVPQLPMPAQRGAKPKRIPLAADDAARRFVTWMQDWGFSGSRVWSGPDGIWEYYLWQCHDENLAPLPEQVLANALSAIVPKSEIRDRSSGKLRRLASYGIPAEGASLKAAAPRKKASKGKRRDRATRRGRATWLPEAQLQQVA